MRPVDDRHAPSHGVVRYGMIGLLVFVVGLAFWISTHGTTTRQMVSIMLSGRVVRVAQAESAFHARYGRFTADQDSLAAVLPFLSDTFVDLRFERADSAEWSLVATPRGFDFTCAASGAAGRPPVTFAALHQVCVQP